MHRAHNSSSQPVTVKLKFNFLALIAILSCLAASAQKQELDNSMHHLRKGTTRQWIDFPLHAKDSQLVVIFDVGDTAAPGTIFLRQFDVSQQWEVMLNETKLGNLTVDENDMSTYFEFSSGTLIKKRNRLQIRPAMSENQLSDDIRIGQIFLDRRSAKQILSEASVKIGVVDAETDKLLPSRITIINRNRSLQPAAMLYDNCIALRTGVIYTCNGTTSFTLPEGSYTIYASRGFEYGVDSFRISLKKGDNIIKKLPLRHEVPAKGWVSCDPHVHTLTYSGHGDATMRERILTIAGEGLKLPVITEHNLAVDIKDSLQKMGMNVWITPITGNEVTTNKGHFNIFPLSSREPVTDHNIKDWNELATSLSKSDTLQVVILNHARDTHKGFRPFDSSHHVAAAGKSLNGWTFPANAMEVMNSGSQQTDPHQLYLDWMGMYNRGIFLTPAGSSDSHDVSRFILGQARTYVRVQHDSADINTDEVIKNFAKGKVVVSFGLFTDIMVDSLYGPGDLVPSSGDLQVSLKVWGPAWAKARRIILYANGQKIREMKINESKKAGEKWSGKWILPKPYHDLYLVAVAEGPDPQVPFWPVARPFQHSTPKFNPVILGVTGAVRIDADNDGQYTSAYKYASALWHTVNNNVNEYIRKLAAYDRSVAIQAAAVLVESNVDVSGSEISKQVARASLQVRKGFQQFISEWKRTKAIREK